jgi:hypothetical protein
MHHEKAIFLDAFLTLAGGWGLEVRVARLIAVTRYVAGCGSGRLFHVVK